ncbi:MAG TPA: XdhC family protein [Acidobacteriota bacterium]|nr:XdhC family protein [Acidobacteriota bacterium]
MGNKKDCCQSEKTVAEDYFSRAGELKRSGEAFATATVVRVQPPTSGKPGDKAIITQGGDFFGWVGGSCVEPVVLREAQAALKDGKCRLIRLAPKTEKERQGLSFHRMTCFSGGAMEVYIEPNLPLPRLLVFGTSPVARSLSKLGQAARFEVRLLEEKDPRAGLQALKDSSSASTFAVIATHGTWDDQILEYCLKSKPAYLGLIASRRRFGAIRRQLEKKGHCASDLDHIHAPAGLDLNAKTPEEVAISILAQIVALKRSAPQAEPEPEDEKPAQETAVAESSSSCCQGE